MNCNYTKKNLLFFILLIVIFPLFTCKKFQSTVIKGQFINRPINKGIQGETIYLKSFQTGAVLTPDKAKIELSTITDQDGNFYFSFDAYKTTLKQRQPVYLVYWPNSSNKKSFTSVSKYEPKGIFQCQSISLNSYFNNELASASIVKNLGQDNFQEIKVVLIGSISVNCVNELLIPSDQDTCEIRLINQVGDFYIGKLIGTGTKVFTDSNYSCQPFPIPLISGTTTLRATIKKNSQTIVQDTTFFAEDKQYYFEFRY